MNLMSMSADTLVSLESNLERELSVVQKNLMEVREVLQQKNINVQSESPISYRG